MPKIQISRQKVTPSAPIPSQRARGQQIVSGTAAGARMLQQGLGVLQQGLRDQERADLEISRIEEINAAKLKRQEENDATAWVGEALSTANLDWTQHITDMKTTAEPGGAGFTDKFTRDFDEYAENIKKKAPTKTARKMVDISLGRLREKYGTQAIGFEAAARVSARIEKIDTMIGNQAKVVQDSPEEFDMVMAETNLVIESMDIPPNEKLALKKKAAAQLPYASVLGRMQRNPTDTVAMLRGSVSPMITAESKKSFNSVVDAILDIEGGYVEHDVNGPANHGINQAANPDIDVKNLTKKGAIEIYKQRYWEKIDGDSLPPNVAMMAMDAAVNQGVSFAKKILKQSGGDVQVMAQLRREKYNQLVKSNPRKYGKYADGWESRIDKIEKKARGMGAAKGMGTYDLGYIQPDDVKSVGDAAVNGLSFDQRIKLLNAGETMDNQRRAVAKQKLKSKMTDFTAMAQSGVEIPEGATPTVEELTAAFGESDGLQIYNDDVKPLLLVNNDMLQFAALPINERLERINARAPQPGEGFVAQSQRQQLMIRAHDTLKKEMDADPGLYTIKHSQEVAQAYEAMMDENVEGGAADYAEMTIAEQTRLGVQDPVVLPKPLATAIAKQFLDQSEGGQDAAVLIEQQAAQWGEHWPAVYKQLSKDLPPAALVIGSGINPAAAERVARISTLKMADLKEGLDPTLVKDTETEVTQNMQAFMSSINEQAGGLRTFNVFSAETKKLAVFYARAGMGPTEAANKAYDELIGENYEFVSNENNPRVQYRVPKGVDPSHVVPMAQRALDEISVNGIEMPISLFGLDDEQTAAAYKDALKEHGYWVTSPDEDGLVLYANGAAVLFDNGEPYMKTWEELRLDPAESTNEFVREYDVNKRGGIL